MYYKKEGIKHFELNQENIFYTYKMFLAFGCKTYFIYHEVLETTSERVKFKNNFFLQLH